jgi:predicted permease
MNGLSAGAILLAVAPVLLVIGAGYTCRKLAWLTAEADRSLIRLTVNFLTPCLIFSTIIGNPALRAPENLIAPPLVGFATVMAGFAIGAAASRLLPGASGATRRAFAVGTGLYNYGYIPLPLSLAFFDSATTGVLFLHNVGVEFALWTAGVAIFAGGRGIAWRKALNPPVFAIAAAVGLNLLHAEQWLPSVVPKAAQLAGGAAIPLGLLLTGATFADLFRPQELRGGIPVMAGAVALRGVVTPWMFLAVAVWLPLSPELKRVVVMQAAMPAAVFPIVLARHYGGDAATSMQIVFGTTLAGLVTIPWWLQFGFGLI